MPNENITRIARVLRKRFETHTATVRNIVARMTDEELVGEYHEHRRSTPREYKSEDMRKLDGFAA
jgi:hypothetical protein